MRSLCNRALVVRVAALAGVLGCSLLHVAYGEGGGASACLLGSGCDAVRSYVASFLGPFSRHIPFLGAIGFAFVFCVSLADPADRNKLLRGSSALAAGAGAVALVIQALVLGEFCAVCVWVDICCLSLPLLVRAPVRVAWDPLREWAWLSLFVVFGLIPFVLRDAGSRVPSSVRDRYLEGRPTVVAVTDFGCRHCREQHQVLSALRDSMGGDLELVIVHAPSPVAPNSILAAKAHILASERGVGHEVATQLMRVQLTEAGIIQVLAEVDISAEDYRSAVSGSSGSRVSGVLEEDIAHAGAIGVVGTPTVFVGDTRFPVGVVGRDLLVRALADAGDRLEFRGPILWFAVASVIGLIVLVGRQSGARFHSCA